MAESAGVLGITDELLSGWLAGGESFNDQDWVSTLDWEDCEHRGGWHSWSDDGYGARQGFGGGHWSEEEEQVTISDCQSDGEPIRGFAASTPAAGGPTSRPSCADSPVRTHGPRLMARDWSYLPGRRNRRRGVRRRINYSDEGELTVRQEVNKKKTGLRWKSKPPVSLKFVDDNIIMSKINMDSAEPSSDGATKIKHDLQTPCQAY